MDPQLTSIANFLRSLNNVQFLQYLMPVNLFFLSLKPLLYLLFIWAQEKTFCFWNCFLEKGVSHSVHYQNLRALLPSLAAAPYIAAWKYPTHVALSFGNKNIWSSSDERSMFERKQSKIISLLTLKEVPNTLGNTSNIRSTFTGRRLVTTGRISSKYFSKWEAYANGSNEPFLI